MKSIKESGLEPLNRKELSKVKGGGVDCNAIYQQCSPMCGHFSTDYSRFAACITAHTTLCSPLYGWYLLCPNG
jgi:hypothetical protein